MATTTSLNLNALGTVSGVINGAIKVVNTVGNFLSGSNTTPTTTVGANAALLARISTSSSAGMNYFSYVNSEGRVLGMTEGASSTHTHSVTVTPSGSTPMNGMYTITLGPVTSSGATTTLNFSHTHQIKVSDSGNKISLEVTKNLFSYYTPTATINMENTNWFSNLKLVGDAGTGASIYASIQGTKLTHKYIGLISVRNINTGTTSTSPTKSTVSVFTGSTTLGQVDVTSKMTTCYENGWKRARSKVDFPSASGATTVKVTGPGTIVGLTQTKTYTIKLTQGSVATGDTTRNVPSGATTICSYKAYTDKTLTSTAIGQTFSLKDFSSTTHYVYYTKTNATAVFV